MAILTAGAVSSSAQVAPKTNVSRVAATYAAPAVSAPVAAKADAGLMAASAQIQPQQQEQAAVSQLEQVQRALDKLKQSIKPALANSLKFEIDESSGKTVVKIMDVETSAVVRQIPSEELLVIARALDTMDGRGGLVKQQA